MPRELPVIIKELGGCYMVLTSCLQLAGTRPLQAVLWNNWAPGPYHSHGPYQCAPQLWPQRCQQCVNLERQWSGLALLTLWRLHLSPDSTCPWLDMFPALAARVLGCTHTIGWSLCTSITLRRNNMLTRWRAGPIAAASNWDRAFCISLGNGRCPLQ